MAMQQKKTLRQLVIGDRAFYRQMMIIVLPIIIQNTVSNVVSLLDNVMVGRVGTLPMSAVAIVNQLMFVFNLCVFGGLAGAGIFATQYAGAKDDEGVRSCFRMKIIICILMLLCAGAVFTFAAKPLIHLYLTGDQSGESAAVTMDYALSYLRVMLPGLIPFAVSQLYASTLRELGETRVPMISGIAAFTVNLLFNWLLIFGMLGFPRLGVVGAAVATVLSRCVEMAILVIYTHRNSERFRFICGAYRSLRIPTELLHDIIVRGMPLLVNEFLWSSGMAVLMQCYSVRGLEVVAAFNICATVANLFNAVFLSLGNATAIMVGQRLGAGKMEEATSTAWRLMLVSVLSSVVLGLILASLSGVIPHIYNTAESVRVMAGQFLMVNACVMWLSSFANCCYFTLRSGGKTMITFLFDSVFTWAVSVPAAWLLANDTSMHVVLLYLCVQSLDFIKCVIGFILVKRGVWINNMVVRGAQE